MVERNALALVLAIAVIRSLATSLYYFGHGMTVDHASISHLLVARKMVVSLTPGFGQLGGTWLPLPHLMMVPTIWNDFLFTTGLSGSMVSMVCYILVTVLVYKITVLLTGYKVPGLVSAIVLISNPTLAYVQATSSPILLALLFIAASVYFLIRWGQTDSLKYLVITATSVFFATMTDFRGWILLLGVTSALVYICIRKGYGYQQIEGTLVLFISLAALGVVLFLLWSRVITGNALYFAQGQRSNLLPWFSGQWTSVDAGGSLDEYFLINSISQIGPIVLVLGLLGFVLLLFSFKDKPENSVLFTLMAFIPLALGKVYLWGPDGAVPYGLIITFTCAILTGYLFSIFGTTYFRRFRIVQLPAILLIGLFLISQAIELQNVSIAQASSNGSQYPGMGSTAQWLKNYYDGRLILMEVTGNEDLLFASGIPGDRHVHEGNFRIWDAALANPVGNDIDWVFMRTAIGEQDHVWKTLHDKEEFLDCYEAIYQHKNHHAIYKRRAC
jgi:4-amino-4-deoxy-L-arabinose transferase-like glycosyltransferase